MRILLAFIVLPVLWLHAISETVVSGFNGQIHRAFDVVGREHLKSANYRLLVILLGLGCFVGFLTLGVVVALLAGLWRALEYWWAFFAEIVDDLVDAWRSYAPAQKQPLAPSPQASVPKGTPAAAA